MGLNDFEWEMSQGVTGIGFAIGNLPEVAKLAVLSKWCVTMSPLSWTVPRTMCIEMYA